MRIGIPTEVKDNEYRVAITPAGVHEFTGRGHEVFVQAGAGTGSSITDADYRAAGAKVLDTAEEVWGQAELLLKVKEPVASEYRFLRPDLVLFTYLHLAADRALTLALIESGTTAIAYETVQMADRSLPLLAPMSEVAGRLAPQVGAHCLERAHGGRGVLLGGVSGVYAGKVVVIGAGVSGMNAAAIALGMQAEVIVLDKDIDKLRAADRIYQGHLQTVASNTYEVERAVLDADLVIGAVLVPGAKAPTVVSNELVSRMKPGSVLVDIAVDQGGCFGCTTRCSTAWPTCPARCRTPPPTPSPTSRCPTRSRSPRRAGRLPCGRTRRSRPGSTSSAVRWCAARSRRHTAWRRPRCRRCSAESAAGAGVAVARHPARG
jgi:alanine dehydrogenase